MNQKYFTKEEKREAKNKRSRQYYLIHKEEIDFKHKEFYQNNKEKIKLKHKKHYENNREKILKRNTVYNKNHKNEIQNYRKNHRQEANEYVNNKLKININFKLAYNLRNRLRMAIYRNQKLGSAVKDLDCSIPFLKLHLESKFKPGMTWDNWSPTGWHIDHIIPLNSFDLSNRKEFLKACHYTNLQPLWAEANWKKSKY